MKPLFISLGVLLLALLGAAWLRFRAMHDAISEPFDIEEQIE